MLFQKVKEQIFKLPQGDRLALIGAIIKLLQEQLRNETHNPIGSAPPNKQYREIHDKAQNLPC